MLNATMSLAFGIRHSALTRFTRVTLPAILPRMIPSLLLLTLLPAIAPQAEPPLEMTTYQMELLLKGPSAEPGERDKSKMQVPSAENLEPFVLGFLVRGPNPPQKGTGDDDIQKGHLAYMETLYKMGKLAAAGSFLDNTKARGVVIYRVANVEEARNFAAADPAVKAGRLVLEAHPWMTFKGILK
jgi:uncharacterized protein